MSAFGTKLTSALGEHVRKLPQELRRSLTWDRGKEMADHKNFTVATNVQVYFCDPRSPWQRGSNANTNGLLRQYFPRGTDLSRFSQAPRGRPWASKPLPIDYEQCCSDQLNPQHKADMQVVSLNVRFSNRPSGSSTFRLSTTTVSMSLAGSCFSSESAPGALPSWDSRTRWNNLSGGLAVRRTVGPSGHANSPHPSSRKGHHSTARWSSSVLLLD